MQTDRVLGARNRASGDRNTKRRFEVQPGIRYVSKERNPFTLTHAGRPGHLLNPLFRPRPPPRSAMGIWDLWGSTTPNQVSDPNPGAGCPPTEATAGDDGDVWEVPRDIGELAVSKLFVHPIKVSLRFTLVECPLRSHLSCRAVVRCHFRK